MPTVMLLVLSVPPQEELVPGPPPLLFQSLAMYLAKVIGTTQALIPSLKAPKSSDKRDSESEHMAPAPYPEAPSSMQPALYR